ncbi:hypothetical protein Pmani_017364 [Petrolisthes manimaculis]|uniref:Uncharacterized protein n=1 Tax=Petrolisthes manimaculis TaxID=1843537 RepID=A0AAE1U5V9_9EUCA|nr:hypothetical protein Pmani_017364 [Petrolisthes manimaculis]
MCQPTITEVDPGTSQSGLFLVQPGRDGRQTDKSTKTPSHISYTSRLSFHDCIMIYETHVFVVLMMSLLMLWALIIVCSYVKWFKRKINAVCGKKKSPPKRSSTYTRNPFFCPSPGPPDLYTQDPTSDFHSYPSSPIFPPAASNCPIHSSLAFTTVTETSSTRYPYGPLPSCPSSPPSTPTNSHPCPYSPHSSSAFSPPHTPSPSCPPVCPTTSSSTPPPAAPTSTPPQLPNTSTPPQLPNTSTPPQLPNTSTPPQLPNTSTPPQLPSTSTPPQLPNTSTPPQLPNTSTPPQLANTSSLTSFPSSSMLLSLPSSPFRPLIGQASPCKPSHIKQQVTILDDEGCDEVDLPLPPPPSLTQQPDSNRAPSDEEWPQVPDLTPEGDLIVVPPTTASPPCPRLPPGLPIHSSPSHVHKRPSITRTHSRSFTHLNYLKNVVPVLPKRPIQSPLYQSQPSLLPISPPLHKHQHLQYQSHQFSPIAPPEQLHSFKFQSSLSASEKSHHSISSQSSLPPIVKPFQMCWKSRSKSLSRPVCSSQSKPSLDPAVPGKSLNSSDKAPPKSTSVENLTATNPFLSAALRDVIKSGVASEGLRAAKAALRSPDHLILHVAAAPVDCTEQEHITKMQMSSPKECPPVTREVKGLITKVMLP